MDNTATKLTLGCEEEQQLSANRSAGTSKPKKKRHGRRERQYKLLYSAAYLELAPNILSSEGKKIVSKDPNLSKETIKKLLALQGGTLTDVSFNFGLPGWGEDNDVGCALLSSCIKDNFQSTWAELVGRYADMRKKPFLEIAIGLKRFHEEQWLAYYNQKHELVRWAPVIVEVDDEPEKDVKDIHHDDDPGITGMEGLVTDIDDYMNKEIQKKLWR